MQRLGAGLLQSMSVIKNRKIVYYEYLRLLNNCTTIQICAHSLTEQFSSRLCGALHRRRYYFTATCQQLTAYIASVPDSALTASDTYVDTFDNKDTSPPRSRLFTPEQGVNAGAWSAAVPLTTDKYLQVSSSSLHAYLLASFVLRTLT